MILSNYSAAFLGNRQLANSNTDEVFDNRNAILSNYKAKNEVEKTISMLRKIKLHLIF